MVFFLVPFRCLPINFRKEDLAGFPKDRMKPGASLADVDPVQVDQSVSVAAYGRVQFLRLLTMMSISQDPHKSRVWSVSCFAFFAAVILNHV